MYIPFRAHTKVNTAHPPWRNETEALLFADAPRHLMSGADRGFRGEQQRRKQQKQGIASAGTFIPHAVAPTKLASRPFRVCPGYLRRRDRDI